MANEKRLIDAQDLLEYAAYLDKRNSQYPWTLRDIEVIVNEQPTVDAVEVVRCKDCKHYYYSVYAMRCVCDFDNKEWDKDDFCSYGEKREV